MSGKAVYPERRYAVVKQWSVEMVAWIGRGGVNGWSRVIFLLPPRAPSFGEGSEGFWRSGAVICLARLCVSICKSADQIANILSSVSAFDTIARGHI